MGKGGGTSAPSEQTVTQSNIPSYAEPYFMAMMDDANAVSAQAYTPYQGQRLAGQSPDTLNSYGAVRDIASSGIPYLGEAMGVTQGNIGGAQDVYGATSNMANYNPYQFSQYGGFNDASGLAQAYGGFNPFEFGDPQMWNSQIANQYMSPYIDNVMNRQKDRAMLDFERMQQYRDAEATKAGAFGGSRQAVNDALAQEELTRQMADIDAMGLQGAYDDAGRMFQADRSTGFDFMRSQADEYGRVQGMTADELARVQGIGIDEARRIQQSQADELARVQSSQAGENLAAGQFGLDAYKQALGALGLSGDFAGQLAGFGEADRAANIQGAQLLDAIGKDQTAYEQAGLDIGYGDFMDQRDWDQNQLSWLSNILRGVPVSPDTTTTSYVPNNPMQDALGMGISAIGLYNGLNT